MALGSITPSRIFAGTFSSFTILYDFGIHLAKVTPSDGWLARGITAAPSFRYPHDSLAQRAPGVAACAAAVARPSSRKCGITYLPHSSIERMVFSCGIGQNCIMQRNWSRWAAV